MTDLFDKLYSQFLSGKTNRKDFEGNGRQIQNRVRDILYGRYSGA